MATVNSASLRDEFDGYKADIDAVRKEGQISKEADVVFSGLYRLLGIVITIFLETPTKKTGKNSSTPPSGNSCESAQVVGRAWPERGVSMCGFAKIDTEFFITNVPGIKLRIPVPLHRNPTRMRPGSPPTRTATRARHGTR